MTEFETYSLIANLVATFSIVATAIYAVRQFRRSADIHQQNLEWNKRIETKRKLDDYNMINSTIYLMKTFHHIKTKHAIEYKTVAAELAKDDEAVVHLNELLSYYESLASGIENHLYDEHLVKTSRRATMIRTYTAFKEYIEHDRIERDSKLWICLEALVTKWMNEERKQEGLPELGRV